MFGVRDQIDLLKIEDLTRETNRAVKGIGAVPGGPSHFHKYSKYLKHQFFVCHSTIPHTPRYLNKSNLSPLKVQTDK